MAALTVSIELQTPLLTGEPHQGNVYRSYGYLPGSVLRGAVAGVLMRAWTFEQKQVPHPEACPDPANCDFCRVLYPHDADGQPLAPPRFHDCYPAVPAAPGDDDVRPFPHTARTCKLHGGFCRDNDEEERHGVWDTLIAQAAAQQALDQGIDYVYSLTCPKCDEALVVPESGHYGRFGDIFYSAQPVNRRFSRTAIDRRRRTAQPGQLFTLEVMGDQMRTDQPKGAAKQAVTRLSGRVEVGDADVDALRAALERVGWLGSGSSRGLGQVTVTARRAPDAPVTAVSLPDFRQQAAAGTFTAGENGHDLGSRLAAFNHAVQQERAFYAALGADVLGASWYFTVDLLSDTFVRHKGRPALRLAENVLDLLPARLVFWSAEPVDRGGWSNAWGLPRPRRLGVRAGGVFLFAVDDAAAVDQLWPRLAALEQDGAGDDRARGAGRVQICAPFHQEVQPR